MFFGIHIIFAVFASINSVTYGFPKTEVIPNLGIVKGKPSQGLPHICSLRCNGNHICGSTLYNSTVAITAAHCILFPNEEYSIECGSKILDSKLSVKCDVYPIIHPSYKEKSQANDIAILKLNCVMPMKPGKIEALKLPSSNCSLLPYGKMASIGGWGLTDEEAETGSSLLMETKVPIIKKNASGCKSYGDYITKLNFCAGYTNGTTDSCQGDSGGPLELDGTLHGIVSFGAGCSRKNYAGVYTKVCNYVDWIRNANLSPWEKKADKKKDKKKRNKQKQKQKLKEIRKLLNQLESE